MLTKYWNLKTENRMEIFTRAGELIRNGELVAFPTETVYGLGANGLDENAARKIYAAKGRPCDNPLILHIADLAQLKDLCSDITPVTLKLAQTFWPGPMTLVVPKAKIVPDTVSAGLPTVAIRFPSNQDALDLIRVASVPVAAPSANLSGRPSPTNAQDVLDDMQDKIAAVIDGGECTIGVESTIIDTTSPIATILRPGGITPEMIKNLLGDVTLDPALSECDIAVPKAPGMKYRHYAPKAPVYLFDSHEKLHQAVNRALSEGKKIGVISDRNYEHCCNKTYSDVTDYTNKLFVCLRDLDRMEVNAIYALTVPETGLGLALMNRLKKAAGKKEAPHETVNRF